MKSKYASLRHSVWLHKNHPNFKQLISARIFKWAKDETLTLQEFAFLTHKALGYLEQWKTT